MPAELAFSTDSDSCLLAVEQLRGVLSSDLDLPCNLEHRKTEQRLILGESGIVLSLALNDDSVPTSAVAEISLDAEIGHITQLCGVFRTLRWML